MGKQKLPGSTSSLVLGISSIVTACCCLGFPGIILGFIGLNKANKAKVTHTEDTELYDGLQNAQAGKITSIIGLVLGGFFFIRLITLVVSGEWAAQMEESRELVEQIMGQ